MSHTGNALGNFGQQGMIRKEKLWHPTMLGSDFYAGFNAKDSGNLIITSGNSVDSWIDFSGNKRNVSSISAKPTYNPSRFLGNPCVVFNNSPMDSSTNLPAEATYSWLCLAKDNNVTATLSEPFSVGIGGSSAMEWVLDYDGAVKSNAMCGFNGTVQGTALNSPIKSSPTLIGLGIKSGVVWARINGINGTDRGIGISTSASVFRLGGSRPQNLYPLAGDIYCFLAIASLVDSSNFLKAEGWMAWAFRIESLLPASHPFRNQPPLIGD